MEVSCNPTPFGLPSFPFFFLLVAAHHRRPFAHHLPPLTFTFYVCETNSSTSFINPQRQEPPEYPTKSQSPRNITPHNNDAVQGIRCFSKGRVRLCEADRVRRHLDACRLGHPVHPGDGRNQGLHDPSKRLQLHCRPARQPPTPDQPRHHHRHALRRLVCVGITFFFTPECLLFHIFSVLILDSVLSIDFC